MSFVLILARFSAFCSKRFISKEITTFIVVENYFEQYQKRYENITFQFTCIQLISDHYSPKDQIKFFSFNSKK